MLTVFRNSDGEVIRPPDGVITRCDHCPCCPTSGTITVTFAGVAVCGCVNGTGSALEASALDLSGPYTLTWNGGVSAFQVLGVGFVTIEGFSPSCGGVSTGSVDYSFDITARCLDGQWSVQAVSSLGSGGIYFFHTTTPQSNGDAIANDLVCGGPTPVITPDTILAGGGTATVSL